MQEIIQKNGNDYNLKLILRDARQLGVAPCPASKKHIVYFEQSLISSQTPCFSFSILSSSYGTNNQIHAIDMKGLKVYSFSLYSQHLNRINQKKNNNAL